MLEAEAAPSWATQAVINGGGVLAPIEDADALLLWHHPPKVDDLSEALAGASQARWVQLPSAGIDRYRSLIHEDGRVWTCAKGVYAEPVAEHALALALAGLRQFTARARTNEWGDETKHTLYDGKITIVGGGGIAQSFIELVQPFRSSVTVVRRHPAPMAGAVSVVGPDELDASLPDADIVLLAAALTAETEGMFGARQFELMADHAWIVNIARGKLIVQDELVDALKSGTIGGAGLDATTPEPLPSDHVLWTLDNCLITPHVAVGHEWGLESLGARLRSNVERFVRGEPLLGVVNLALGY